MDARYINPFLTALKTVFKTMLSIDIVPGKPGIKGDYSTSAAITGFMSLSGEENGFMRVGLQKRGTLFVYKSLLFEDAPDINADVIDAIGEVMNIVAGQARKELEAASIPMKVEAPTVIVGPGTEHYPADKMSVLSIPFSFMADGEQETVEADFALK
jgi:chemotaxis protein CheX